MAFLPDWQMTTIFYRSVSDNSTKDAQKVFAFNKTCSKNVLSVYLSASSSDIKAFFYQPSLSDLFQN